MHGRASVCVLCAVPEAAHLCIYLFLFVKLQCVDPDKRFFFGKIFSSILSGHEVWDYKFFGNGDQESEQ